jgi:short-subunit dehydrogenase
MLLVLAAAGRSYRPAMNHLAGRPIAITGASSGIGKALAIACANAGMPVAVGARREEKLRGVVETIRSTGGRAVAIRTDVDREDDCRRLIDTAVEAFGSVYAVVANAGYGLERAVAETSDAELRAIFETNFFGTMNVVRPALSHMLGGGAMPGPARAAGHIIIVSSCLSKLGTPYHSAYSATKAAQDHLARALRLELASAGIAVSSLHPIGTRTEFFVTTDSRSGGGAALHTPEWLMQTPERVARTVLRALSRASRYHQAGSEGGAVRIPARGLGGEIWTSTPTRLLLAAATAFPGLADRLLASHVARRNRHYRPSGPESRPYDSA